MSKLLKQLDFQEEALDAVEHHLSRGTNRLLGVAATGLGKGHPLSHVLPTPNGFVRVGDLSVGDHVFGADGKPTEITGVFDRGPQQTYYVKFSDGTYERVDGDHLWSVYSSSMKYRGEDNVVIPTRDLVDETHGPSGRVRWYVPVCDPVEYPEKDLPLDPYALGVLLGDGGLTGDSVILSSADPFIVDEFSRRTGWSARKKAEYDYIIDSPKTGRTKEAQTVLRQLGVFGKSAHEKSIPEEYLTASIEQRLDLLRGLMDTDGTARGSFCSVSLKLADDVARLVRSLGGVTRVRQRTTNGGCGYAYRVSVNTPDVPFLLPRKVDQYTPDKDGRNRSRVKSIVDVTPSIVEPTRCISVAADDSLYLTANYTVTHNTAGISAHVPRRFEPFTRRMKDGHGGLLFIVHRREILRDAAENFREAYPDKWVGIEMGEEHIVGDEDFIFASADSIGRVMGNRILKMQHRLFGAIITDECFTYDTVVQTEDGPIPIGTLVKYKYGGKIRSLAADGTYIWQRATDWIKTRPSNPIFEIRLGRASKVRATGNHEWLTPDGYIRTDELTAGTAVYCDPDFREAVPALTDDGRQIVMAGILGDGSIDMAHADSVSPRMKWTQRNDRSEYLDEKFRILGWSPTKSVQRSGYTGQDNIDRYATPSSPELREFYGMDVSVLIGRLTPLGIAHYFGDDGSRSGNATYNISAVKIGDAGRAALVARLADFGVRARALAEGITITGAYDLRAFEALIGPHLPPPVRYKLIGDAPAYVPPPTPSMPSVTAVIGIEPAADVDEVYCLRMDGAPNFMVGSGGFVVHNCHHLTEDSKWDNILNYFGVGSDEGSRFVLPNGEKPLSLMLTATPNRTDGRGLQPFADEIAFEYNYPWGVRNGWLVDIKAFWAQDMSGVTGGEHATESEIDYLSRIVRDYGQGEKSLVFARSVAQSAILARTLNERRIVSAAHVDGNTDKELRAQYFDAFKRGEIDLLSNYAVFQEGTNVPGITTIFDNSPTQSPVLAVQKPGRGTRPHPEANVYALKTAAERREAIEHSPKPWLNYVCMFDPRTNPSLNVVASLTGYDTQMLPASGQTIMEVVDVIEYMEEERPEVPIRDIGSIDELQVRLQEVSIWDDTVYNDDLKALTKLEWVQRGNDLTLYLPENPFAKKAYDRVPVVIELRKRADGRYEERLIEVGGWNKHIGRVRKAAVSHMGWADDANAAVRKIDNWLLSKAPSIYRKVLRGGNRPATPETMKYLKNNQIKFDQGITESTARLLAADHRIQTSLKNVG